MMSKFPVLIISSSCFPKSTGMLKLFNVGYGHPGRYTDGIVRIFFKAFALGLYFILLGRGATIVMSWPDLDNWLLRFKVCVAIPPLSGG
jgi:hypothetical protein